MIRDWMRRIREMESDVWFWGETARILTRNEINSECNMSQFLPSSVFPLLVNIHQKNRKAIKNN